MAKKNVPKSGARAAKHVPTGTSRRAAPSAGAVSGSGRDVASYVRTDESGAMRVGAGDVPVDSVVAAFHQGHSPEMIRRQYPSLTLEEVYGAIAYYLANRDEVDAYLERQDALWKQWRARSDAADAPVVRRLRSGDRAFTTGSQGSK